MANDINFSQMKREIANATEEMKKFSNQINSTASGLENLTKTGQSHLKTLASQVKDLNSQLEASSKSSEKGFDWGDAIKSSVSAVDTAITSFSSLHSTVDGMKKSWELISPAITKVKDVATTAVSSVGSFITGLSPTALGIGAATIGVTALVTTMVKLHEQAVNQDIQNHFGQINLSAEEVEDTVKRLTTTNWSIKLQTVSDAFGDIEQYQTDLNSAITELNKLDWKVSVGIQLTKEEEDEYKKQIGTFNSSLQSSLQQEQYAVSLSLDSSFGSTSATKNRLLHFSDQYYSDAESELSDLGTQLANLVNDSFENGTFSENNPDIQTLRTKMVNKLSELTATDFSVTVDSMLAKFSNQEINLDKESFEKVVQGIDEAVQNFQETEQESYDLAIAMSVKEYEAHIDAGLTADLAKKIKDDTQKEIDQYYKTQESQIIVQGLNFSVETLEKTYGSELSSFMNNFSFDIGKPILDQIATDLMANENGAYEFGLDEGLKKVVDGIWGTLQPDYQQVQDVAKTYLDAGKLVPQSLMQGLSDTAQLGAVAGDLSSIYLLQAKELVSNPEAFDQFIKETEENGKEIDQSLADAIQMYSGLVYDAQNNTWVTASSQMDSAAKDLVEQLNNGSLDANDAMIQGLVDSYGLVYSAAQGSWYQLKSASYDTQEDICTALNDCGINASGTLIQSISELTPNLRGTAVELINQLKYADEEQRPELLAQLMGLGVAVDDSIREGMYQNIELVRDDASGLINVINTATGQTIQTVTPEFVQNMKNMGISGVAGMDQVLAGSTISAPQVSELNTAGKATNGYNQLQSEADQYTVTFKTAMDVHRSNTTGSWTVAVAPQYFTKHANGGFVDKEQLSWIAEGDKPEVVIPLDPGKRTRAMQLFAQTSELLGVSVQARNGFPLGDSLSPSTSVVDYSRLAALITDSLKSSAIQCNPVFQVSQGDVYLDSEKAGRALTPVISRIQAKTAKFETR
ncbi:hypothetical protein [Massilioclostridium coli]|uniref:hypothetical protein n=1 Tax=Massilioclostridium coli TaxID=1870991 RepID=UPI0022E37A0A|nr:hypothetical protein [Massilioclostridium coli]